jgi:hypothetical protein
MDEWTNGRMDAWTRGRMDAWAHGRMGAWAHGRMDAWTHARSQRASECVCARPLCAPSVCAPSVCAPSVCALCVRLLCARPLCVRPLCAPSVCALFALCALSVFFLCVAPCKLSLYHTMRHHTTPCTPKAHTRHCTAPLPIPRAFELVCESQRVLSITAPEYVEGRAATTTK